MRFLQAPRVRAWLAATSLTALSASALAADRPADPAGAKAIADFIASYAGKAAAPSVKIATQGLGYLVTMDLAALNPALKPAGFRYDPAELQFHVFQQTDGQWRIETAEVPPISGRSTAPNGDKIDLRVETRNVATVTLLDPQLNWIASSKGSADSMAMVAHGPGLKESIAAGKLGADVQTRSGPGGLTTTVAETLATIEVVADIDPKAANPEAKGEPVHVAFIGEGGRIDIAAKDFQPGPLTEAWRFFANHPERADYARDFDALKTVVNAVLGDAFTLDESLKLDKLHIATERGPVEVEDAAFGVGAVNAGADSGFSERFAAKSIKLPQGMVPEIYAPLVPTSFDVGFKASGFDLPGAAQEWFANADLNGDGPPLSPEARDKVTARLVRGKPIVIDILPSRVVGASLNLAFQGRVTIDNAQPTGSVMIEAPNFDQMAQAIQGLGPQAEEKLVPVIAMAKGLGKAGPDGALIWVCDIGRDRVMKVNGLPLGKAPF